MLPKLIVWTSLILCPVAAGAQEVGGQEQAGPWRPLFNGKDLLGWHVNENHRSVYVENGCIVAHGKRAHVFYVGPTGHAEFDDFHFKTRVKTTEGSNSGIYFHTKFLNSGWPDRGYEAQVNNTHGDPKKTGGLYDVKDNLNSPVPDGEWFDFEIIVRDRNIILKINGETVTDYTEPQDLDRPERQLSSGTFALQAHDPNSKVLFKDLWVKVMDDSGE